jgi:hypothetical protein
MRLWSPAKRRPSPKLRTCSRPAWIQVCPVWHISEVTSYLGQAISRDKIVTCRVRSPAWRFRISYVENTTYNSIIMTQRPTSLGVDDVTLKMFQTQYNSIKNSYSLSRTALSCGKAAIKTLSHLRQPFNPPKHTQLIFALALYISGVRGTCKPIRHITQ